MDDNNYLEHYGVLGMKWGVRKSDREQRKATGAAHKLAKLKSKAAMKAGKARVVLRMKNREVGEYLGRE